MAVFLDYLVEIGPKWLKDHAIMGSVVEGLVEDNDVVLVIWVLLIQGEEDVCLDLGSY